MTTTERQSLLGAVEAWRSYYSRSAAIGMTYQLCRASDSKTVIAVRNKEHRDSVQNQLESLRRDARAVVPFASYGYIFGQTAAKIQFDNALIEMLLGNISELIRELDIKDLEIESLTLSKRKS